MSERLKKYIGIEEQPNPDHKTKVWQIYNKQTSDICGYIKWYGGWRKYVFETIDRPRMYDWELMRDLAEMCETKTQEHYANRGIL